MKQAGPPAYGIPEREIGWAIYANVYGGRTSTVGSPKGTDSGAAIIDSGALGSTLLDVFQNGLDGVGVFDPTPLSDGLNALIHAARGNYWDAGISVIAMVPFLGDLAKGGKYAAKGAEAASDVAKAVGKAADAADSVADVAKHTPIPFEGSMASKAWKSSNLGDTSKNAALLRRNLGHAISAGEDAHHIVPSTHARAAASRKLLDKYQIDINDAVNGIGLKPSGPKPAHHGNGLHSYDAIDTVTKRLNDAVEGASDWASGRKALLDEVASIKGEIAGGQFP